MDCKILPYTILFCLYFFTTHAHLFPNQLKGVDAHKKHLSYIEELDSKNPKKAFIPFHPFSHYSFFFGKPKWQKRVLKYAFNKNMKEEQKVALEEAVRERAASIPFRFIRVDNLGEADIKMSFMPKYHGDGYPFVNSNDGWAHTFAPPDGRIHFDRSQNWSARVERGKYDIRTAALHELGHALGLGHSKIKDAVMYYRIYPGERKRLNQDDVQGIKALYNM